MHDHIAQYFQGERREMFAIIIGSLLLGALVVALVLSARDAFSKAMAATVLLSAALLAGTAVSLLVRDSRLSAHLASATTSTDAARSIADERSRIEGVISKYPYYRYAAAGLGVLALVALLASRREWAHGVAAGLLLLVTAQVLIDHYSERRAQRYVEQLASVKSRE